MSQKPSIDEFYQTFYPVQNDAVFDVVLECIALIDGGKIAEARAKLFEMASEIHLDSAVMTLLDARTEKGLIHVCQ